MNILFFNSVGRRVWGGGEKWMLSAAIGLRQRGHQVYLAGRTDSLFLQRCAEADFQTLSLKIAGDISWSVIRQLRRFYLQNQIDVVIPNYNKGVRLAGMAARLIRPRPLVIARNGAPVLKNNRRYRYSYRWLADGIITNTEAIKNKYLSYGWLPKEFIRVIHNGIAADIPEVEDPTAVRKRFRLPPQGPVIAIFGRLVSAKRHDLFLQVAGKLKKYFPDAVFMIVGDGPMRASIIEQGGEALMENIHMIGHQQDVFALYSISDVVLLTSRSEGMPNVIMEAMLAGRPVLTFDVGGVRELIVSEKMGVVIPPNDVYLMSRRAAELLKNKEARQEMGIAAREYIRENFSLEQMITNLESYLFELKEEYQTV